MFLSQFLKICVETLVNMEEFYGKKYEMVDLENFEEMLIFIDIGYVQRQVAMSLRPTLFITKNEDDTYTIHMQCMLFKSKVVFTPGVEFDETKPDGNTVRALVTICGNKVAHRQVEGNGRTLNHVYEFFPDKMVITTTAPGLEHVVKRHFVAI